ncbi:hypothetical protein ACFWXA_03600 [Streptomyces atroolivaceus]|uniref:hypothetical protein n=1 Tax=Streptomyces atroolivaceus TaxID=66869 RepID=UPI003667C104
MRAVLYAWLSPAPRGEETSAGNWEAIVSDGMFRALVRYLSDPSATRAARRRAQGPVVGCD